MSYTIASSRKASYTEKTSSSELIRFFFDTLATQVKLEGAVNSYAIGSTVEAVLKSIDDKVIAETSDRQTAVSDEATARGNADTALGSRIDVVQSLASGASQRHAFATYALMIAALTDNTESFLIGDSIYLSAATEKDYWVCGKNSEGVTSGTGVISAGIYCIQAIDDKPIDLTGYLSKTEAADLFKSASLSGNVITITQYDNTTVTIDLSSITAAKAVKLSTARTVSSTGDVAWTVTFDGSSNVSSAATLSNTGITAGTYSAITVDAKGRATAGAQIVVVADSVTDSAIGNLAIGGIAIVKS